jgi:hypothetical protein
MSRLQLVSFSICMLVLLVCCQTSQQNLQMEQDAKVAVMQEKERGILAECELKRLNGELKTYVASTECSNPVIIRAHQDAGDPAMNLIYLITAYRLAIAERIDKHTLSEAEANLMLAQLISRVNTERLQRDIATAQWRARTAQTYEALLQGLGIWQRSAGPAAQASAAAPSEPASEKTQPALRTPITCYQNEKGPGITCR